MFSFFKSKPKPPSFRYLTYLSKVGKYKQVILEMSQAANQPALLIYFFDTTKVEVDQLCDALGQKAVDYENKTDGDKIILCSGFSLHKVKAQEFKKIAFIELHPLATVSQSAAQNLVLHDIEVVFNIGLDEPLMTLFGSERIPSLLRSMGTLEDEMIEHNMINKSIENAQKKVEKGLPFPKDIRTSPEEWAKANKV
jgi:hypothetical protein